MAKIENPQEGDLARDVLGGWVMQYLNGEWQEPTDEYAHRRAEGWDAHLVPVKVYSEAEIKEIRMAEWVRGHGEGYEAAIADIELGHRKI